MLIGNDEVHLWYARDEDIHDRQLLAEYRSLLSEDERQQQQRFYFRAHRHQYLITRALVRCVLSFYADVIPPERWVFARDRYNRPYITNNVEPLALDFNISHTEKAVLLAVTTGNRVGVDIEYPPRRQAPMEIAEKYFSAAEFQSLCELPVKSRKTRFYQLWTLKEAYIKACGGGLSIPLDQFTYSFQSANTIRVSFHADRADDPRYWAFWQIRPNDTHLAALAVKCDQPGIRYGVAMHEIVPLEGFQQVHCHVTAHSGA